MSSRSYKNKSRRYLYKLFITIQLGKFSNYLLLRYNGSSYSVVRLLISGILGTTELGAQAVILQMDGLWYQVLSYSIVQT